MNREARNLGSYGVQSRDDTLICPLSATQTAIFDLVPLGESPPSGPDDAMAEGVFISLKLLLTYAHRQNHRRRTQPPPPISAQKKAIPIYNLLRAILARLKHQESVEQLNNLLGPLCHVMESARLNPLPSFKVTATPGTPPVQLPQAEQTILSLVDRLETIATFSMSESTIITIAARIYSFPVGCTFSISLSPDSPLMGICPPPATLTSYPALRDYIQYFTACAIATSIATIPSSPDLDEASTETHGKWHQTPHPTTLRTIVPASTTGTKLPKTKQLSISIEPITSGTKNGIKLRAYWEWTGKEQQEGTRTGERKSSFGFPVLLDDVQKALKEDDKKPKRALGEGVYDWVAWEKESGKEWDDGEGEVFRTLESVVAEAGQ